MLNNCLYNKIKLLHQLSSSLWFIHKHAMEDAREVNDTECIVLLENIQKDLETHMRTLKDITCK